MVQNMIFVLFTLAVLIYFYASFTSYMELSKRVPNFYEEKVKVSCILKFDNLHKRSTGSANCINDDTGKEASVFFQDLTNALIPSSNHSYRLAFSKASISNVKISVTNLNEKNVTVSTQNSCEFGAIFLRFSSLYSKAEIQIKMMVAYEKKIMRQLTATSISLGGSFRWCLLLFYFVLILFSAGN